MLKTGRADTSVAGAYYPSGQVIVAAARVIGTKPGVDVISSGFLMLIPKTDGNETHSPFVFGDCGVNPNPNPSQLASIAKSCADMYSKLIGGEPFVSMMSFSSKGSGRHDDVSKVTEAVKIAHERFPDIKLDGELQADTSLVPAVASFKAPDSPIAGKANVLVFPDLDAGNIGYKLVERLANAVAVGPLLQGVNLPYMDLSRGCRPRDIFYVTAAGINLIDR
jgi:phosphate acetyltransferase